MIHVPSPNEVNGFSGWEQPASITKASDVARQGLTSDKSLRIFLVGSAGLGESSCFLHQYHSTTPRSQLRQVNTL